jgi:glycosyltransferase involved in cell wall biosynthesis
VRISIISTLGGEAWGGSEELWAAAAQLALERGISVSVYLCRPYTHHPKWEALRRSGAELFTQSSLSWFRARILGRADLLTYRLGRYLRLRPLRAFLSTLPDVVLVSDCANDPPLEIIDAIEQSRWAPYVILSEANVGNVFDSIYRKRLAHFYRHAYLALFVAKANLITTERQLLEKLLNARVVANPVNLESFEPVPWPEQEVVRFASVARLLVAAKGQDILLEILSDARWGCREWQLSIYGTGVDEEYLKGLSKYYGLSQRVSFLGRNEDIRTLWQSHHALVLPSRYEGMPLVAVEAMICGRPVIATAVGGIPEWVRDEHNGFLAPAPTVDAYAAALERAWQRRAEWKDIGEQARKDALNLHDPGPGDTLLSILIEAAVHGKGPTGHSIPDAQRLVRNSPASQLTGKKKGGPPTCS